MTETLYYEANTGHFGFTIKVCFSDEAYQQALKDSEIHTKHDCFTVGIAESHYIELPNTPYAMLGIVFNYEEMKRLTALDRLGIIYHEVSHTVTHVFQYIGEDEAKIGDESRAYLGEYLFKQVVSIYETEDKSRASARKRNRKVSNQTNKEIVGAMLQVAELSDGSARQNSYIQGPAVVSGVENHNGSIIPTPMPRIC
jgi:hypothetical protein